MLQIIQRQVKCYNNLHPSYENLVMISQGIHLCLSKITCLDHDNLGVAKLRLSHTVTLRTLNKPPLELQD